MCQRKAASGIAKCEANIRKRVHIVFAEARKTNEERVGKSIHKAMHMYMGINIKEPTNASL